MARFELPTGTWQIDTAHSSVNFAVRHMMVAKVRGRFNSFAGTITVGDDRLASSVEASIDAASIETRDDNRDAHLRSADFFDAASFPTMTFRSTSIRSAGDELELVGDLTIKDVTRPVTLTLEVGGTGRDPWGSTRVGFSARGEINRKDFGLTWNAPLETGGVLVGDKVTIELDVEAVHQAAGGTPEVAA